MSNRIENVPPFLPGIPTSIRGLPIAKLGQSRHRFEYVADGEEEKGDILLFLVDIDGDFMYPSAYAKNSQSKCGQYMLSRHQSWQRRSHCFSQAG